MMGEAGSKHVISAMQGYSMIAYNQHSKMCVQKVASQYNEITDWDDDTLLCENYIFNY